MVTSSNLDNITPPPSPPRFSLGWCDPQLVRDMAWSFKSAIPESRCCARNGRSIVAVRVAYGFDAMKISSQLTGYSAPATPVPTQAQTLGMAKLSGRHSSGLTQQTGARTPVDCKTCTNANRTSLFCHGFLYTLFFSQHVGLVSDLYELANQHKAGEKRTMAFLTFEVILPPRLAAFSRS
eukprot:1155839-Pelagomonas_calceolata.AAC.25